MIAAALVVVVLLILLEYYILWCLTHTLLVYNEYFVFLCIAPIAAVVTILAFMLLGVFRVNSDLGSTPLEAIRELLLES